MLCRGWGGSAATAEVEGVDDNSRELHVDVVWLLGMMYGWSRRENQLSGLVHY